MATGPLTWSGNGNIYGIVSVNGGTINVPSSSAINNGGELINTGPLTWTPNTGPRTGNGAVISNAPSGVISVALNGNNLESYAYGGTTAFYNAGTINVSGVSQSGSITDPFFNTGTVNINNGTLSFADGGTNSSTINVGSGANLDFSGGSYACTGTSLLAGAGNLSDSGNGTYNLAGAINLNGIWNFFGGTLNLLGSSSAAGSTLNISGGTVNFNGTGPWLMGTVNMTGGTLEGSQLVTVNGPFNLSGGSVGGVYGGYQPGAMVECNGGSISGSFNMFSTAIINTGTLAWTANPIFMYGNTLVTNLAGATINAANAAWLNYGSSALGNAGRLNIWANGQATVSLLNSGTVNVNSGTLSLDGGGTNNNAMMVASGGTLQFGGGNYTVGAGGSVTGAGTFQVSGGTVNVSGLWGVSGPNVFSGGTANITGICNITNGVTVSGGTANFSGSGTLVPTNLTMTAGTLEGSQLVTVNGPFNMSGG